MGWQTKGGKVHHRGLAMVAYEMNLLLSRRASPYRSLDLVRRCARMVVNNGGVVRQVANHGIRPLGYKIRKNQETHLDAHYITLHTDMNPKVLEDMQQNLKVNDIVLRWMAINQDKGVYEQFRNISAGSKP